MAEKGKLRIYKDGVAIVTGGSSGIGRALCEALGEKGCEVIVCDVKDEMAEKVAEGIRSRGGKATAVKLDVADYTAVEKVVNDTYKRTGRLDFIFNNAGMGIAGELQNITIDAWNKVLDVNLRGVVNGVHAAYKIMYEQGFGHIINTASFGMFLMSASSAPYLTSKWGIYGLTKTLCIEMPLAGVRVSCLIPGFVRTDVFKDAEKYGVTEEETAKGMKMVDPLFINPSRVAKKTLKKVAKNKDIICTPGWIRVLWWYNWFIPSALENKIAKWSYMMLKRFVMDKK